MNARTYLFGLEKLGIKFGLENIGALCTALGEPQRAYPSVIIAGTNGKGSVAAMVERGLREAGLATGLYTSPHLVNLEERFRIGGTPVTSTELDEAAERARETVARLRASGTLVVEPTFFEVTTAIAFELFRRRRVELAVLEVGLGGRWDATNIATPLAAAITTIDFDHQQFLGNTLAAIAGEKAGVIKRGMTVVVGEDRAEPFRVIEAVCRAQDARLVRAMDGVEAEVQPGASGLDLTLTTPRRRYGTLPVSLKGRHQVQNAIVAVRLLEELGQLDFPVSAEAVAAAVTQSRWPGRLDLVDAGGGRQLLCDAAHNPAGARVLGEYLKEFHPAGLPLVFAIMRDKDLAGTLGPLLPWARPLIVTRPSLARAQDPAVVAEAARRLGTGPVLTAASIDEALSLAWSSAPLAAVAGSIFLVGEVLERLGAQP